MCKIYVLNCFCNYLKLCKFLNCLTFQIYYDLTYRKIFVEYPQKHISMKELL